MFLVADDFLTRPEIDFLHTLFDSVDARSGLATAGALASVKRNRELDLGDRDARVKKLLLEACNRGPILGSALLPKTVSTPLLSVYEPGMAYGTHIDSAVGNDPGGLYRSDLSCTVFLDDPADYDGGELSIELGDAAHEFKLSPGQAVFYPTLFRHQVRAVSRGRRRACVFWLESLVPDPNRRAVLLDLVRLHEWIVDHEPADSEHRLRLLTVRENLYRMWIET